MTYIRTFVSIAVLTGAALVAPAWATAGDQHDSHHPASDAVTQVAQAPAASQGADMQAGTTDSDYASQMQAMRQMHDEMMAAKTPEERRALMPRQMKLMQGGMDMMGCMGGAGMMGCKGGAGMMGGMGGMGGMGMMGRGKGTDAATDKAGDMATRHGMMEQRMDMMQSMLQMMMDRMQAMPETQ